jgi:DNA topoisomerase-1
MSKTLLIVESPAKSKTLGKYLGKDFIIKASYGHVRDLVPKEGAVDPEHGFAMKYEVIDRNKKHVDAIATALKTADTLLLATDPDREGEAISWHLYELLKEKKLLEGKKVARVVFNEITKKAVLDAVANPRELSIDMVNSQQARRALDYLVGFNLSPLLWKKVRRGLSAGRVQSPALRLIVERELAIEKFKPKEYWTVEADCIEAKQDFMAKLSYYQGKKITQFTINETDQAHSVRDDLIKLADDTLRVAKVEKKKRRRNPSPPFITSTLQQEASRKIGFTARKTMQVAQKLYEGIDVGNGAEGLITYMRTDSVTISQEAVGEFREYIGERWGQDQIPAKPRVFKTSTKNAQEAHEAIRPTLASHNPDSIKAHLDKDQYRLYDLIWKRALASQMIHATIHTVAVDLAVGDGELNLFRATGSTIADPGFMAVYKEGTDDSKTAIGDKENLLPVMEEGQMVTMKALRSEQHFTEPPPRFSEATLVKVLEEFGIGRPSTYASIISTLQQREYVEMDKKRFIPTDVGRIVNKFLTDHFTQYVDYDFTARLEDQLDEVSRGEKDWVPVLKQFWDPFHSLVEEKDKSVSRKDVTHEALDEKCPKCGKPLSIRLGRRGRFIGCSTYPECDYTRNLDETREEAEAKSKEEPEIVEGRVCPECGSPLHIKVGRYGKFIGCSGYPKCKHIEPLVKPKDMGILCPECGKGNLLERRSRRGKMFYSCATYPKCKYAVWNPPVEEPCPKCGWPILTLKTTKRRGVEKVCPQKECDYAVQIEPPESAK